MKDGVDDRENMEVECGQYQDPPVRVARDPGAPTEREVEEHNATHLPHRSWCPVCVKARSKEDPHDKKNKKEQGGKPIVAMDYKSFGEDASGGDKLTMIVLKDEATGCVAAHVCSQKGASDQWAVDRICDDLDLFGHTEIVLKSDGEPAIMQVQNAVKSNRNHPTICQNPPAYDPQANGSAERAVQEVMNQVRAMKIGLQSRIGAQITTEWKIMEWIVELSTVLLNRCLIGKDGKTAYARLMGKDSTKQIAEIGERVLAKIERKPGDKKRSLRSKWEDAIWVGIAKKSNEHIVVLEDSGQAIRCRTMRRRPMGDRWKAQAIAEIRASPRMPNPKDPEDDDVKPVREPAVREVSPDEVVGDAPARPPSEVRRRNFRITKQLLQKYGYTPGCKGCDAALGGRDARAHDEECRERIEAAMEEDPEDNRRIRQRDERIFAEPLERGEPEDRFEEPVLEPQGQPQPQAEEDPAEDQDVLYGREGDSNAAGAQDRDMATQKRESPDRDGEQSVETAAKKRRLVTVYEQTERLLEKWGLKKYDGSRQVLRRLVGTLNKDREEQQGERIVDVTRVMDKIQKTVQDYEERGMCSPHEDDQWRELYRGVTFYDDVNGGLELDKDKVIEARKLEMQFFMKMGVYSKVDRSEVAKAGGKVISTKWIDTDKGGGRYRSRLVGRELKFDKRQDLFSPTPPLETLKLLIAKCAKGQRGPTPLRIGAFDVSRAYFYAPCRRPLYIEIPDEDWVPGDERRVGKLHLSLYGTRDAAQNWAAAYTSHLQKLGFRQGRASLCNFVHVKRNIALTVHGDDFLVVASLEQMRWLEAQFQRQYEIKSTIIGPEAELAQELQILNRTIRWAEDGIEYEADQKHARLIMQECEVLSSRQSKTPGTPDRAGEDADPKALPDLELGRSEVTRYRAVAARIMYLSQDRVDLQFAAKEISRRMARPAASDWVRVRHLARYLKYRPRAVQKFRFEYPDNRIAGYADSDWAGERSSMKSTSGGVLMWGSSLLKSWSTTQATVALSVAEAELYALSKCAQQLMAVKSTAADFQMDLDITAHSDSSAALGIAYRSGLGGRTRHVKVQYLWIQGAVSQKDLQLRKVGTAQNPADMLTKFLDGDSYARHCSSLGMLFLGSDRCEAEQRLEEYHKLRLFCKHLGLAKAYRPAGMHLSTHPDGDSIPGGVSGWSHHTIPRTAECRSQHGLLLCWLKAQQ